MADRHDEAKKAHERGWVLTPLRGKIPRLDGWQKQSAPTLDQVARWVKDGNVGLRTGRISGVYVVDEDTAKGGCFQDPPTTPTVLTGGDGKHFYFQHPGDEFLGNSAGKIGPHIDTRGDGGQVVFVGSVHPDTKKPYRWAPGLSPDEVPLAPLPAWVLALLRPPAKPTKAPSSARPRTTYALRALDDECHHVANAPNGTRNDTLNKAAFNLGQLVGGGYLERSTVEAALTSAAEACGEEPAKARATIKSGIESGILKPRVVPEIVKAVYREQTQEPDEPRPQAQPTGAESVVDLPEVCWRHGFSAFREACTKSTEASDAYIWGAYLSAASLVIGRNATLDSGIEVYPNVYVASVGATGKARKSTAQAYFRRLISNVDQGITHSLGIGSPEGLIEMLSDTGQSKRCVVDLNELSSMLLKASAEATRGLGPLLTTLYDCPPSVRLPNRKSDLTATSPYLCIISSTTQDWLQRDLSNADVAGGLANRFVYLYGPEKEPIPFPPKRDPYLLGEAEQVLIETRDRHSMSIAYEMSDTAQDLWSWWYTQERKRSYDSPILESLAQRLHLTAWKVALIFAAIEGTKQITFEQLEAAITFADYQRDVHAKVFHGYGQNERQKIEQKVMDVLRKIGPMPGWKIAHNVRRASAGDVRKALEDLSKVGVLEERQTNKGRREWFLIGA